MILISLLLIGLLLAAWKAPRWVREIGLAALVVGIFAGLLGLLNVFDVLASVQGESISQGVLAGGLKVCLICPLYGMLVYLASLVIRIIQKPRV